MSKHLKLLIIKLYFVMINMDNIIEMMRRFPSNITEMKAKLFFQSSRDTVQQLKKEVQMKDIYN